ncbi:MAG: hypothetical protein ACE5FA_00360 [Dehalococcoidia bacterium]
MPPLRPKFDKERRQLEAKLLFERLTTFKSDSNWDSWVSKLKYYDLQWRARLPRTARPWDHASDFNPHLTWTKVEDVHAVLYGFFQTLQWYSLAPAGMRKGISIEEIRNRAEEQTELLRWSQMNESKSLAFLDRYLHSGVCFGSGTGSIGYMRDSRNMRMEIPIPEEMREATPGEDIPFKDFLDLALGDSLLGDLKGDNDSGFHGEFVDDDGQEKEGIFWVDMNHPFRKRDTPVIIAQREVVHYDAPETKFRLPWEIMVPSHSKSLQSAREYWVTERMGYNDIVSLADMGVFNTVTQKELRALARFDLRAGDPEKPQNRYDLGSGSAQFTDDTISQQRDEDSIGPSLLQTMEKTTFEVVMEKRFEDVDGDGFAESIVRAAIHGVSDGEMSDILLMQHPIEYIYPHGRRNEFDWHLFPVHDRYPGMGVPEVLEKDQIEENAFHQSRSDVIEIITKPGGMYESMSGLSPESLQYRPGMLIRTRDPQRAYEPFRFPVNPTLLFSEQVGIETDAERAIGATDMGLGRSPSRGNAPRTLGGTAILVRQQQMRTAVYLQRALYGQGDRPGSLVEWLHQYRELMAAFMPEEKQIELKGRNEPVVVKRADLQGRFTFTISFDPELNNPQLKASNAVQRYQLSVGNPLVMQNPQALWHITQDMWKNTGYHAGPAVLPSPTQGQDHPPMSDEDVIFQLSKGIYVSPVVGEDLQSRIQVLSEILNSPAQLSSFGLVNLPLLVRHVGEAMTLMTQITGGQVGQQGAPPASVPANGAGPSPDQLQQPNVSLAQTELGRESEGEFLP